MLIHLPEYRNPVQLCEIHCLKVEIHEIHPKTSNSNKNSSGDEIANVNFFYDDTLQSYRHLKI